MTVSASVWPSLAILGVAHPGALCGPGPTSGPHVILTRVSGWTVDGWICGWVAVSAARDYLEFQLLNLKCYTQFY